MCIRDRSNSARSNPELFDVSEIVTECFNLLQVNAEKKNIKLIKDISSPFRVYADKNMILTVIRNLINNALKFTNEGGQIIVSAKDEADICRISVEDTGVGMDDKTVTKLFRLDENVTTTGTSGETGTGLGLIICKEFIDKNNGQIKAESRIGSGSTFTIILPAGNSGDVKVSGEFAYQKLHIESAVPVSYTHLMLKTLFVTVLAVYG